jgi:XTP/dITP diphosphohydrolase
MEFFLATNNAHKALEFLPLFQGHTIKMPRDAGIDFEFEETGSTFLDNTFGKAMALYKRLLRPTLADDSGLCVDALDGEPGVRSARYGSEEGMPPLTAEARNALLLDKMKVVTQRSCRFVCCMCLVLSPHRFIVVQESCEGVLLEAPRGCGGFGYDPIFYVPQFAKSMAELDMATKNIISHRGRAATRLLASLQQNSKEG